MKHVKITTVGYQCERCDHKWVPRVYKERTVPVICPKCKSPYWTKPPRSKMK